MVGCDTMGLHSGLNGLGCGPFVRSGTMEVISMPDAQVVSIVGEQIGANVTEVSPGIRCKAGHRHTSFEGNVYVRTINGVRYWVEVVQCSCLTWRTTKFYPNTGVRVGQRKYWRPKDADWPDDMSQEDCQRVVLESMLTEETEGTDSD